MKTVTIDEVPKQISDAAEQLASYFNARGVLAWSLGGVQSKRHDPPPAPDPRIVDATVFGLTLASSTDDRKPSVENVFRHLGLICSHGRIVRLQLPNGRTIRVTLE